MGVYRYIYKHKYIYLYLNTFICIFPYLSFLKAYRVFSLLSDEQGPVCGLPVPP